MAPYRVSGVHRRRYRLLGESGETSGVVTGRFVHQAACPADFPTVGDWVGGIAVPGEAKVHIHAVLPRHNAFQRKARTNGGRRLGTFAGATMILGGVTEEQLIAANIDSLMVVAALDAEFNPRRIERYVTLAHASKATPVLILNKVDMCSNRERVLAYLSTLSGALVVHFVSAKQRRGLECFSRYLEPGATIAFVGSSGVGKSSLINALLGFDRQKVLGISRAAGKGVHTTTERELIVLPTGGIVIDTPGLRDVKFWGEADSIAQNYDDIEQLIAQCRFSSCRHSSEPGCAVNAALKDGTLEEGRYRAYQKLLRESLYLELRRAEQAKKIRYGRALSPRNRSSRNH